MPVKLLVTSVEEEEIVLLQQKEFLGEVEEVKLRDEAIELRELLNSVIQTIGDSIQAESKLTIEISGSVRIGGSLEAGVPQFFAFNLFRAKGEGEKADAMKLRLETTVKPSKLASSA